MFTFKSFGSGEYMAYWPVNGWEAYVGRVQKVRGLWYGGSEVGYRTRNDAVRLGWADRLQQIEEQESERFALKRRAEIIKNMGW